MGIQVQGQIKSASKCQPINMVNIQALNHDDSVIAESISDKEGYWTLRTTDKIVKIIFHKEGFVTKNILFRDNFPQLIRLIENEIIGYHDKTWFLPGEEVQAYIHSPYPFRAELKRYGHQVDKILDLGTHKSIIQQVPDKHFVDEGLKWSPVIKYKLPANLKPGIYSLFLSSLDGSQKSYGITFLVSTKPDEYGTKSRLLVLASSNNWECYNWWGGRSRYLNSEKAAKSSLINFLHLWLIRHISEPIKPLLKGFFKTNVVVTVEDHPNHWYFLPLSIQRPHPDLSVINEDVYSPVFSHLAPGEWRILAWLEREGLNYDIISGYELHQNPGLLNNYNALILSTHCEYWTKEMYNGLKFFQNNGGAILNLSGNSIYREIEYINKYDLHCISLRLEKSVEDESQLIGVRFDIRGYLTSSGFKVIHPEHWVFKGSKLKKGDIFASHSLNQVPGYDGGSGWETDKLTKTAPKEFILLAKGGNKNNGGSDMVIKESNGSDGLVFSASSITFGGTLLIDEISSQLVKNILQKVC